MKTASFILVTPAYNEAAWLPATIESVLRQTCRPVRWVIVDDESIDETGAIIRDYAQRAAWIKTLRRRKEPGQSYYSSNVYAILEGIRACGGLAYDYLAILDADIVLPDDYYESLLGRFERDPRLGIASGVYQDRLGEGRFRRALHDRRSTPKALMVFRRECYEATGGLIPMKYGGEDTIACFTARMKGWKTWSFPELVAVHNKPIGTGHSRGLLTIRFRQGFGEYFQAADPLFMFLKCLRRCLKEPPFLIGGGVRFSGYLAACFRGEPRQLSPELIRFIRREQRRRIVRGNRVPVEYQVT